MVSLMIRHWMILNIHFGPQKGTGILTDFWSIAIARTLLPVSLVPILKSTAMLHIEIHICPGPAELATRDDTLAAWCFGGHACFSVVGCHTARSFRNDFGQFWNEIASILYILLLFHMFVRF